jgi:hypothetical protein
MTGRPFKLIALSLLSMMILSACGSTGTVMQMGPDTYTVTASKHNMSGGASDAQNNALASATAYCSSMGKDLLVKNAFSSFERPYYSYSITFRCLAESDPALKRPTDRKSPDTGIVEPAI